MRRLIDYLPKWYKQSPESVVIQEAIQPEIDALWAAREDMLLQIDPRTATWGLDLWEAAYGLPVDAGYHVEARRSNIIARIIGSGTTTVQRIKDVVSALSGSDVEVVEDYGNYTVHIKSTASIGNAPDVDIIRGALAPIMPAHLAWSYTITLRAESTHLLYSGFAVRVGRRIAVACEIPPELNVNYVTDEDGNLLTDEAGNRIIDEEE